MLCLLCKLKVQYCVYRWTLPWTIPFDFLRIFTSTSYSPVHVQLIIRNQDSMVGIVTRLCAGWSRVQFLAGARDFSLSKLSRLGLGPTQPLISWQLWVVSSGAKWPGHGADRSPQPSADFQNEWSCTSVLPSCPHCVYGENFTFYFFILVIFCEKGILWSSPWYKCIQSPITSSLKSKYSPLYHVLTHNKFTFLLLCGTLLQYTSQKNTHVYDHH